MSRVRGLLITVVCMLPCGCSDSSPKQLGELNNAEPSHDAALAAGQQPAQVPESETLQAHEVLDRMAKTYGNCKTYRDSGVVKSVLTFSVLGKQITEKPFTTAFVRPDRFRFEFKAMESGVERRYLVWQGGNDVKTWWDVKPGVEKVESLGLALAGPTGVSGGSAHTIPALLLPREVAGRRLTDLTEPKRLADAKIDDVDCFVLDGQFGDRPMTLWIDKQTFLVRRIAERDKLGLWTNVEKTTTYDPIIDDVVPDEKLAFDYPQK